MELVAHSGKSILFIMAVHPEYGPELKRRFTPLFTGVGPVESGIVAANTLAELASASRLPDLLVCLGSAGSRVLEQTEIYQASSVSYRDMDASALGFEKGVTPFLELPGELEISHRVPGIPARRLSTGADIVSGQAYEAIGADMVDMETYSVKRAAMRHDVPVIALRGISDGADELHHIDDWTEFLHVIDEKLAKAVDLVLAAVENSEIKV